MGTPKYVCVREVYRRHQYLHYLPDLKAAWLSEQDVEMKEKMEEQYLRV